MTDLATNRAELTVAVPGTPVQPIWRWNALFVLATLLMPLAAIGFQRPMLCIPYATESDCASMGAGFIVILVVLAGFGLLAAYAGAHGRQVWRQALLLGIALPAVLAFAFVLYGSYGTAEWPNPYCALDPCTAPPATDPWVMP